jgi:hypothetical protein
MKKRYDISIYTNDDNIVKGKDGRFRLKGSAFNISYTGYWMAHSSRLGVSKELKKAMGISFKNKEKFSIQDKIIYRFPKLDLPRQKVDLLKEKYNVKVIRDPKKANVHVVSEKLFENLFESLWNTSVPFKDFFNVLDNLKKNDYLTDSALSVANELIKQYELTDSMIRLWSPYTHGSSNGDQMRDFLVENISNISIGERNTIDVVLPDKNVNDFLNIKNSNIDTVYDTDITEIIDKELAIINNTEYDNILKMIMSSDKDNRSLALEMLANCNINKSFDVVSGIFYWEYDWLKDTTNWNTVNVKALRKRLSKYSGGTNNHNIYSYNNYINYLIEDKQLTEFAINKTRESLYKNVLGSLVGDCAEVFNVKFDNLTLKEKLIENIIIHD